MKTIFIEKNWHNDNADVIEIETKSKKDFNKQILTMIKNKKITKS